MNFDLTEDRQMLSDTLRRYLSANCVIEKRNEIAYSAPFHSPQCWSEMAELGIPGALVDEAHGGYGGTGFDIAVVFEELGRALCPEPFLGTLLASRLLLAAGADQQDLIDGSVRYAVAISELDEPYDPAFMIASATRSGEGYALEGRKTAVYGGHVTDVLLVAAMLDGRPAVFSVEAKSAALTSYGMIDGGGAAEVVFDATPATLLIEDAGKALDDMFAAGRLALCAEAVGAMDVAYTLLLDYLRTRKQFGTAIGKFQALQHRAVDLLAEIEQARSITISLAAALGSDEAMPRSAMAKGLIGRVARLVAEETIQMQGGIAMTWEYASSHYAKRLVMIDHQLGDTDQCEGEIIRRYAAA
ncbi:alkylation response protein AidB-like acyl-CoA dehydrogenase [Breoghania corrubedonensis]|uniref:Alkylation response protein AidB-like acyl-CoA dehydrogenase n=1 Tax=Breoghania corrubedonensis TaxID=665038 RepID=A0A2T5US90_9HYPH|nr:acyl-CoA dehydrogenase family protein [Breoghania corrubedonensis]PTW54350.1 alkylation response protein AidB-like acyl-CoA dehydrogenase [Breoghania corrubedonensis]